MEPHAGCWAPHSIRKRLDLPEPVEPTIAVNDPGARSIRIACSPGFAEPIAIIESKSTLGIRSCEVRTLPCRPSVGEPPPITSVTLRQAPAESPQRPAVAAT